MKNAILYVLTVLIWGISWYPLKLQVGTVHPEVSLYYRFLIAFLLMYGYAKYKGADLSLPLKDHALIFIEGAALFSLKFILFYQAALYFVSGLISTIYGLVIVFNIINARLFLRQKSSWRVIIGAFIGILGIVAIFSDEVDMAKMGTDVIWGIVLSLLGTYLFSIGNIISKYNQERGISIIQSMTLAMGYGVLIMLVYTLYCGHSFMVSEKPEYWISLLYLSIVSTVIAFLFYLNLVSNIGPQRAGYITLLTPLVAIAMSMIFEGFRLSSIDIFGIVLVFIGNFTMMMPQKKAA
jgi:drug/metabolite transporter (DMT)-like permease